MLHLALKALFSSIAVLALATQVQAQTATYHLHKEASSTPGNYQLKTANPDSASFAAQSADLSNAGAGEYVVGTFDTQAGVPNAAGTIPSGSSVNFTLWMKKTANHGTMYPLAKLNLNSVSGASICTATGLSELTTTLTKYTLTCMTSSSISMAGTDRFYLWTGVNLTSSLGNPSTKAELDIEGTLNGNYDSLVIAPLPPSISSLSPTSGQVGTTVTVSGSTFGATQGTSTVKFNGTTAAPTSWSDTSIVAPVPAGASTGPVVVTVAGATSNGVTFTVIIPGTIAGTITRSSDGTPISGALVEALQSSVVKGSATTATNGGYSIASLVAGTYDVRVSAAGYLTQLITGISVAAGATTTVNAALSPPPVIASLSPSSGLIGASVTISGSYFGATQGTSTVTFNGISASPTSWSATSIVAPAPPSATTGPVVVTVSGGASNGVTFTVLFTGGIAGTITRASDSAAVSGALIEALQSGVIKASANSATNGGYSISGVVAGTYDVRISASGYVTKLRIGIAVAGNGTATVDVALSKPGTISGKVTQLDGTTPIVGAGVEGSQGTTTSGTSTTNATGDYSIGGLNPGTYTVQASAIGYKTQNLAGVAVSEDTTTTSNFSLEVAPVGSGVSYIYDKLGRLIAAVDLAGDTARYNYDEVGNLLSISRQPSSLVSIIEFTPGSGTVGAPVTIYGTGFSATASQNTVTFNGVAASVTSSTSTQILTSVPNGATTGPIAVTSPSGSATSSTSFTVSGSSAAPTITGFAPTIGAAGDSVTISGTNFETAPANDRVTFNGFRSTVSSATATAIASIVPPIASSGHISVTTPSGRAVSAGDFFFAPSPFTAASVEATGRMAIGESRTVTISTADKIGLIVFDGTAGQRVSLNMTNATIFQTDVGIINPNATTLASGAAFNGSGFIGPQTLPATGTYTILVDPRGSSTGSITLSLYNIVDVTGTITPGGSPVTVNITAPGQNALLTFSGAAAQRVSLNMTNATIFQSDVSIMNPDGTYLVTNAFVGNGSGFIDATNLPSTGTYTILVDPRGSSIGNMTLTLYDVIDVTGTITIGGSSLPVSIATPGQDARITFSGVAGQWLSLGLTGVTITQSDVTIVKPDGTNLVAASFVGVGSTVIVFPALPATGTYAILVNPRDARTGNLTLILSEALADAITIGGSSVTLTIARGGQYARVSFTGTAGQILSLGMTSVTITNNDVSVINPDGTTLVAPGYVSTGGGWIDMPPLPASGTYTIIETPRLTNTGSMTLTLSEEITGTITVGGPAVPVTIARPAQNARLTFSGTSGQQVTVQVASNTMGSVTVSLLRADGTTLTSTTSSSASFALTQTSLPATETYTVRINPAGLNTGSMNVSITSP